ncbi:MAG: tetratricopeptide repeat protein [Candidatus Latescibacteria bacterium]|nr:tetratricopeptide repeat protein [Candidatus Latescibacterota bacterium]
MRPRSALLGWAVALFLLSVISLAGAAQAASPSTDPQAALDAGQALYTQGRFAEAEAEFQRAVQLQPKSASARYWLGMTYYAQNQDKQALEQFQRAIQYDRKDPNGHVGLGLVYMRTKNRMMDAREELKEAARLDPKNGQIQYYIGLSQVEQSKRDPAAPMYIAMSRQSFEKTINLDPNHPDAYYQLALTYEYPSRDYNKAIPFYFKQLSVTPGHRDALAHFGKCVFQTGRYQEGVALLKQLMDAQGNHPNPMMRTVMAQLNASYFQAQKQYDRALDVYDQYLSALNPKERGLYTDLAYVASEDETERYARASEAERAEVWRKFWASRDPDPATVVNERLVEHYRRVMYARENFSRGKYPWDRRGDIYIRYGEPDDRQHFLARSDEEAESNYRPTGNAKVDAIREMNRRFRYRLKVDNVGVPWVLGEEPEQQPDEDNWRPGGRGSFMLRAGRETQGLVYISESWVYVPYNMELFFVDQLGLGSFDYPLPTHDTNVAVAGRQATYHPQKIAETLIAKTPEGYQHDYGGLPLDFMFDAVTYKGQNGQTLVEVAYSVPARQLGDVGDGQGLNTWFDSHVVLRDDELRRVAAAEEKIGPIERPLSKLPKKKFGVDVRTAALSFLAPAGSYRSAVEVRDEASRRIGIFEASLTVDDYSGNRLNASDIKLATSVKPQSAPGRFVRHGLEILPNPSRLYHRSQPVYVYYEVYNLSTDASGRTTYRTALNITAKDKSMNLVWKILSGFGKLVNQSSTGKSVLLTFEDAGTAMDERKYTAIDTGDSPAGAYTLTLTVTDLHTGQTISKTTEFTVAEEQ